MKLGYIGLGKMGFNMVERLLEKGYEVVVFGRNEKVVRDITGARGRASQFNTSPCFCTSAATPHMAYDPLSGS